MCAGVPAVVSAFTDAEKAGRELLHFEERGMRARARVEELVHHHRGRLADRLELDMRDPRSFNRQLFDETLIDNSDLPGFQPELPQDFDLEALAAEVEAEAKARANK